MHYSKIKFSLGVILVFSRSVVTWQISKKQLEPSIKIKISYGAVLFAIRFSMVVWNISKFSNARICIRISKLFFLSARWFPIPSKNYQILTTLQTNPKNLLLSNRIRFKGWSMTLSLKLGIYLWSITTWYLPQLEKRA
jgi:hypothetical protein